MASSDTNLEGANRRGKCYARGKMLCRFLITEINLVIPIRQTSCLRQPTKNNFSFEKTHQVSNLTDTLTEEPTDDIDVSSFSWHICRAFKGSPAILFLKSFSEIVGTDIERF